MLFVGMMLAGSILRREPEFVEVGKTERVPVEKAVTETVTQEVEVTPPECVQALDLASEGFILSAEVMGLHNRASRRSPISTSLPPRGSLANSHASPPSSATVLTRAGPLAAACRAKA